MRKYLLISLFFWTFGCSHSNTPTAENEIQPRAVIPADEIGKAPIGNLLKAKALRVSFSEAELSMAISEFVAKKPNADYDDVAEYANKQLELIGIPFDLIGLDAEPMGTDTLIKTVEQQWLNVGLYWEPICAEGIAVRYPVSDFEKDKWTIRYKNGTFHIRAKPVRTGQIVRIKDNKVIREIPLPEEGFEPGGIKSNGKGIFGRLQLNAAANHWWRLKLRRDPKDEPPYLVYVLTEDGIEFSENESDLDNFQPNPERHKIDDEQYEISFPELKYKFRSIVCT